MQVAMRIPPEPPRSSPALMHVSRTLASGIAHSSAILCPSPSLIVLLLYVLVIRDCVRPTTRSSDGILVDDEYVPTSKGGVTSGYENESVQEKKKGQRNVL